LAIGVAVDDLVAVRLTLESGDERYFMTWGRIQDAVDPGPLEKIVLKWSKGFSLGSPAVSAAVCLTLQEARDQPYFFEAVFSFAQQPIPFGDGYEAWRRQADVRMRAGKDLYYLGKPIA
jgi:hypothetical protein